MKSIKAKAKLENPIKTLHFDLYQWQLKAQELSNPASLDMVTRNIKKEYFTGSAFDVAFPLSGIEANRYWKLKSTTYIGDEVYEFTFAPDGLITFSRFIVESILAWAKVIRDLVQHDNIEKVECVAYVR